MKLIMKIRTAFLLFEEKEKLSAYYIKPHIWPKSLKNAMIVYFISDSTLENTIIIARLNLHARVKYLAG